MGKATWGAVDSWGGYNGPYAGLDFDVTRDRWGHYPFPDRRGGERAAVYDYDSCG
ncbi:hypothetical protein ACFCYX_02065 [Streptomyces populi]|uniref:hypothetical protein n=1 Tax=Streptomyces populi TaxID=2058924 RepID=UPI0035D8A552